MKIFHKLDSSLNFLSSVFFFLACTSLLLNEIMPNFMDIAAKFGNYLTISIFNMTEYGTVVNYLVFGIAFIDNGG